MEKAGATVFARIDHQKGAKSVGMDIPGATVFARIDHQKGAKSVGMDIPGATLILFGNPKIGYLSPDELQRRYGLIQSGEALKKMGGAAEKLTGKAAEAE